MKLRVKKLNDNAIIPTKSNSTDSGMDLYSLEDVIIRPGETRLIKTGIAFDIPPGYEIQVRPRSGMSLKTKFRIANSPGTVDSGYQGDISIIGYHSGEVSDLFGLSDSPICISKGDRIAQAVLCPVILTELEVVDSFDETTRGTAGFGSSGI